jgi:hypothetical protein
VNFWIGLTHIHGPHPGIQQCFEPIQLLKKSRAIEVPGFIKTTENALLCWWLLEESGGSGNSRYLQRVGASMDKFFCCRNQSKYIP